MDLNNVNHQRRPALIPANNSLSDNDKKAIRLRTGNILPEELKINQEIQSQDPTIIENKLAISEITTNCHSSEIESKNKRKASTSADQYYESHPNATDMSAQGNSFGCQQKLAQKDKILESTVTKDYKILQKLDRFSVPSPKMSPKTRLNNIDQQDIDKK